MKNSITILVSACFFLLTMPAFAQMEEETPTVDSILQELEQQLKLSKESLEKLKPVLKKKSDELNGKIKESVDDGFVELEKLKEAFKETSDETKKKTEEILTSEEVQKLKEYLDKLDKETAKQVTKSLTDKLSVVLDLTEEQAKKVGPILEESFLELNILLHELFKQGQSGFAEFSKSFDAFAKKLHEQLESFLNEEQLDKLDQRNQDLKEKIQVKYQTV